MKKTALLFSALALMGLGCDDSSGSHHYEAAPTHFQIKGKISDPAVKGAKLELFDNQNKLYAKCGVNGNTLCNVWSKEDGSFTFTLPIGTDVTDFSIKSLGGEDSAYGYELPISYFLDIDNFSNNKTNMIVSPFTSLAYHLSRQSGQEQAAKEKVARSFGLSQDIIFQDPEGNAELIKWGYIITSIAIEKGGSKPMEDIAIAIERGQGSLLNDNVMEDLLKNLFGSNISSINKIKALVKTVKSIQTTNPKSVVENIKKEEKIRIFLSAFKDIFEEPSDDLSVNAVKNLKLLLLEVEKHVKNIPVNPFIIEQMVRYLATLDNGEYGKYITWDKVLIGDTISKVFQGQDRGRIIQDLMSLSQETVYSINIPTTPLGMNNQARVNYYFNSTADTGYKIRYITRFVTSDNIVGKNYYLMAVRYAQYGLSEKAKRIVDVGIADNILRIQALAQIASYTTKYNYGLAKQYADEAKRLQEFILQSSQINRDSLDAYARILSAYIQLKDKVETKKIISRIFDDLLKKLPNDNNKFTIYNSLMSKMSQATLEQGFIPDLILSGNYDDALEMLTVFTRLVDETPDTAKNKQSYYQAKVLNYGTIMGLYDMLVSRDSKYKAEVVSKFNSVLNKFNNISDEGKKQQNSTYYMRVIGERMSTFYNILGASQADIMYKKMDQSNTDGKAGITEAEGQVFIAQALAGNFDQAIKRLEETIPLEDDYSNLNGSKKYAHILIGYGNNGKLSLAKQAMALGKKDIAEKAATYFETKLRASVEYAKRNNKTIAGMFYAEINNKQPTLSLSASLDRKYEYSGGLAVLAELYHKLGKNNKAIEVLNMGVDYLTSVDKQSILYYLGNVTISYLAGRYNDTALANSSFMNSRLVTNIDSSSQKLLEPSLYVNRAYDAMYLNVSGKDNYFRSDMATALNKIYSITGDDKILQSKADEYTRASSVCYRYGYTKEGLEALKKSESVLSSIATDVNKKNGTSNLVSVYAKYDLLDEGIAVANKLFSSKADVFGLINKMAEELQKSHLSNTVSYVAGIDTDKDGKPDFFLPTASDQDIKKSGLVLDDDIDGDGIKDENDTLPYVKGTSAYRN